MKRSPRGLWLPGGQPTIDWTNPITAGLVGCWVVTGEGGPNPFIRDLVTQNIVAAVGVGATIQSGTTGMQACDNNVARFGANLPVSQTPPSAFSILWFGSILGASGTNPFLIGAIGTGGDPWGLYRSSAQGVSLITNNAGSNVILASTTILSAAASGNYCVLGSATSGLALLYKNGVLITSSNPTISSITSVLPKLFIGATSIGGGHANAGMSVGLLWNRQLTPGESALISADPTNFLLFPGDQMQNYRVGVAALAAVLAAVSTTTSALTTAIQMQAAPAAASVVSAAMLTSIRLAAALASVSTAAASITTAIPLLAAAASAAATTAALTTNIVLQAAATSAATANATLTALMSAAASAVSSASGSLTTAIRLAASMFSAAIGSGTLSSPITHTRVSPFLSSRQRMIARKGRSVTLRHGAATFTDTTVTAFVHAYQPREIVDGLKQGDQHVETLADITPVAGDKLLIDGKPFNIIGAPAVIYDGATLLGYSLTVRG